MKQPKAISNTTGHRTNAEKESRAAAEKAALTGIKIRERKEVANNEYAHEEFERLTEILDAVGKNDAIIETVVNRYCLIIAECADFENIRDEFRESKEELQEEYRSGRIDKENELKPSTYYKLLADIQKHILDTDRQIQTKRRMLFDIEKENGFTIAAALRSIPKKSEEKKSALQKALEDEG